MVVCSVRLVCSHDCGLLCHWTEVKQHYKHCHCSVVTACARGVSIDEALKKYLCDIQVEVTLLCVPSKLELRRGLYATATRSRLLSTRNANTLKNVHAMISIDSLRDFPLCARKKWSSHRLVNTP
ncbi:hypothetical protein PsorP6_010755 [Peronosclerospora sorghi]|uniref:Uncharacterized protein n=1 Tax=Peronosclerospora sorghi TaxID=230839 RepID=A0ACC0VXX2_9STRA|nr:hypothetical protein PsorP6_010755 [Peronosclerospora sorghi]